MPKRASQHLSNDNHESAKRQSGTPKKLRRQSTRSLSPAAASNLFSTFGGAAFNSSLNGSLGSLTQASPDQTSSAINGSSDFGYGSPSPGVLGSPLAQSTQVNNAGSIQQPEESQLPAGTQGFDVGCGGLSTQVIPATCSTPVADPTQSTTPKSVVDDASHRFNVRDMAQSLGQSPKWLMTARGRFSRSKTSAVCSGIAQAARTASVSSRVEVPMELGSPPRPAKAATKPVDQAVTPKDSNSNTTTHRVMLDGLPLDIVVHRRKTKAKVSPVTGGVNVVRTTQFEVSAYYAGIAASDLPVSEESTSDSEVADRQLLDTVPPGGVRDLIHSIISRDGADAIQRTCDIATRFGIRPVSVESFMRRAITKAEKKKAHRAQNQGGDESGKKATEWGDDDSSEAEYGSCLQQTCSSFERIGRGPDDDGAAGGAGLAY